MLLLIFVLCLVIFFTILPHYATDISKQIGKYFLVISDEELNMRMDVKEMKAEQDTISMTDEFAKFAKLQRKIDKTLQHIKTMHGDRQKKYTMLSYGIRIAIYLLQVATMLTLILWSWNSPLMEMPSAWFFPFHRFVAAPTGCAGCVGITCWIMVTTATVHRLKKFFL